MPEVVVSGVPGALTDRLRSDLQQAIGECRWLDVTTATESSSFDTWVHVAISGLKHGCLPDLALAERAIEGAIRSKVRHVVVVSSTAVHEPTHHHPGHVGEGALAHRTGNPIAGAWRQLEKAALRACKERDIDLTVLRPAPVVLPGGDDYFSRLLTRRWAFILSGFDPSLQLLRPAELSAAVARVIERGAAGTFHVAPNEVVPLRKALRAARCRSLPLPRSLHALTRGLQLQKAPREQLDYIRYPWTVSGEKIRQAIDFEAASTSSEAVSDLGSRAVGEEPAELDDFGLDKQYVSRLSRVFFRFLHDIYWRIEWRGMENIPRQGRAVLAGFHRGHQPWDGIMTLYLLVRELERYPRFLIHPTLVKFPHLAPYMTRLGGVHACRENAARILERDGLLAIYPEGIRGAFAMYRDAYKLGKFGRDEFVKMALRHQAPIVPYVTVGSAEIFPIFARIDWKWWRRASEWPFLPITPTMSTVPLPSKWHTRFLDPIPVDAYPPEAANDLEVVRALSQQVREQMEEALAEMLSRRRSIWWGSVFENEPPAMEELEAQSKRG